MIKGERFDPNCFVYFSEDCPENLCVNRPLCLGTLTDFANEINVTLEEAKGILRAGHKARQASQTEFAADRAVKNELKQTGFYDKCFRVRNRG